MRKFANENVGLVTKKHSWREMGARSLKEARACNKAYLRRRIGICITRQNARLKDRALGHVLGDPSAAEKRRANSKSRADRLHAEYARQASVGRQSWARS